MLLQEFKLLAAWVGLPPTRSADYALRAPLLVLLEKTTAWVGLEPTA